MTLKYILFDLDGTLTESGPGIKNGVRYALESVGIVEENDAVLETFIGPPLVESFAREYGKSKEEGFRLQEVFREYYGKKGIYENEPYPGVRELLTRLQERGHILVLASSKPFDMAMKVLTHFDLREFFSILVCGEDQGPLFTKAGVIAEALRRCALLEFHSDKNESEKDLHEVQDELTKCDKKEENIDEENDNRCEVKNSVTEQELEQIKKMSVMIGDRFYDTEGARTNGIPAIGAGWGYAPEGELEATGVVKMCKDVAELQAYLI